MNNCLLCKIELRPENASKEHIIPNALGGKLKSNKLICSDCNSKYGADCDAILSRDLNYFANMLNIKRESGKPRKIQVEAKKEIYNISPGGKPSLARPVIEKKKEDGKKKIEIKAKDKKQAKEILKGIKRKEPSINVEEELAKSESKREYINEPLSFKFALSGKDAFRAIAKMLFLFIEYKRPGTIPESSTIVEFIRDNCDYNEIYYYCPEVKIVDKPDDKIYHSLVIKSYFPEGKLIGFVELFSVVSFIVVLANDFKEDVELSYVYDVLERSEVKSQKLRIPRLDNKKLADIFKRQHPPFAEFTERFEKFAKFVHKRQGQSHFSELADRAIKNSLGKYPDGTIITKEMANELVEALIKEITPYLNANLGNDDQLI